MMFGTLGRRFKQVSDALSNIRAASSPVLSDTENVFIFMGVDADPLPYMNEFQFWAASLVDGQVFSWPAITANEELFDLFREMRVGQVFRVSEHEELLRCDGGWGVHGKEIDTDLEAYPVFTEAFVRERDFSLA